MTRFNKKQFVKEVREKAFKAYCQDILKDFTSKQAIIESNYKQGLTTFDEASRYYINLKVEYLNKYRQAIKFFNIKL